MRKNPAHKSPPPLILIAVFLIFSAGIIFAAYRNYQDQKQHFRAGVSERLAAVAESKVAELVQWRMERMADMQMLCDNPVFIQAVLQLFADPDRPETHGSLQAWPDLHQMLYGYEHVFLLDDRARQQLASPHAAVLNCDLVLHTAGDIFRSGTPASSTFITMELPAVFTSPLQVLSMIRAGRWLLSCLICMPASISIPC